jgi:hypothetical protein
MCSWLRLLLICQLRFSVNSKLACVKRGDSWGLPSTSGSDHCANIMGAFCKTKHKKLRKQEPPTALNLFGEVRKRVKQAEALTRASTCMACGRQLGSRLAAPNCFEKDVARFCSKKNNVHADESGALACDEVVHLYCSHTSRYVPRAPRGTPADLTGPRQ